MLDILIKNGKVIDGTGAPYHYAGVGIASGEIAYVGSGACGPTEARITVDARGQVVCPGFIDIHSHADTVVLRSPPRVPKITQGVTTEVFSNCGGGMAPVNQKGRQHLLEYGSAKRRDIGFDWLSVREYLKKIPPTGVNIAYLVPHGALRVSAMGYEARHATGQEIEVMCALADEGMADGAFGMSTGLAYVPMQSCETREVIELSRVVARRGGLLADHMRNYREKVRESVDETTLIAREAGIPIQLSHYQAFGVINWGRGAELAQWIADAREAGLDITFDSYPYDFSAGGLKNTIPARYHDQGAKGLVACLADPATRQALRTEIGTVTTYDLSRLMIVGVTNPALAQFVGKRLPEAAQMVGKDTLDFLCDALIQDTGISHINFQGNAEDVKILARSPYQMVGSDSGDVVKGEGLPHPRLYGTFPRFLKLFVRDEPILTWEQAIHKMSGFPAWRLGLIRRGQIRPGFAADIVVLDPARVEDRATMLVPEEVSSGIDWVIVNGVIEVERGQVTGDLGGRVLRKGVD
jgi:N-acyl-D-amino-acid deacylase